MTPRELQVISALAVFLTASLPAAAGAIAFRTQPILAATLTGEPGKLPGLTGLFFNNFKAALLLLMFLGAAATIVEIRLASRFARAGSAMSGCLLHFVHQGVHQAWATPAPSRPTRRSR